VDIDAVNGREVSHCNTIIEDNGYIEEQDEASKHTFADLLKQSL
jgi:hypothetical protein